MTTYEDFITKVKQDVSSFLSIKELLELTFNKRGTNIFLVIHGSNVLAKLDVSVIDITPQYEGAELRDAEIECRLSDGKFFKMLALALVPTRNLPKNVALNLSRMFSTREARNLYFDGIAYSFEIEEERLVAESKARQEKFLSWFVRRMGGPDQQT